MDSRRRGSDTLSVGPVSPFRLVTAEPPARKYPGPPAMAAGRIAGYKAAMRRRIIILGIVILVVIGAWTAGWFYVVGQVRQNVTALATADGTTTPRVTCERLDTGGWPFWIDATCTNFTLTQGDVTASLPALKASLLAYDPREIVLFATPPLTVSDAFSGSRHTLEWSNLEASARLTGWRIARVSIVGDDLKLSDTVGDPIALGTAKHAEFHVLDNPGGYDAQKHLAALRSYITVQKLAVPGAGITAGNATFDAGISNLPDDVRTYGDPNLLKNWQAAGGKLTINGFSGQDGANNFNLTGALSLDPQGRPAGQLKLSSKGLVERFQNLVPAQMKPLILGNPAPDGSYTQTFNLTNGVLFSGVVPLTGLPSVF